MRKQNYLERASQPTLQPRMNHTHEVRYQSAGGLVTVRCHSNSAAQQEADWQARQGRVVEVKAVAT